MEASIAEIETDSSLGETSEVKINRAQLYFTIIVRMAVQALVITADSARIAPLIQPD
jgi:hypothetical protein